MKIAINYESMINFDYTIRPIIDTVISNRAEIHLLRHLRDELLPKLMNGEIEVPIRE